MALLTLDASGAAAAPASDRRPRLISFLLLLLLLSTASDASAQRTATPEYQLKAVFLFNFAQFVDWPPSAFPHARSPVVIGVLGEDPFGSFLDEAVQGETIGGHPLVVQRYRRIDEALGCHILFISRSEAEHLGTVFAALKGRDILTVGDSDAFVRRGGMIQFVTVNKKIRLRIDPAAAQAANLVISSKLLRPAEIVTLKNEAPDALP